MAFVDVMGASLFYESVGEGEPVVLIPGGFLDHTLWMLTVPIFSERFRVVTLDPPGHGQSGGSWDPAWTTDQVVEEMSNYLAEFVEKLGFAPAHFAGQSSGGAVVLQLAARRPDLFRSMSLHEPTIVALHDEEFREVHQAQIDAAKLIRSGDVDGGLEKFVETLGGDWSLFPEPFKVIFRQNAHNYTGEAFADPTALPVPPDKGLAEFPHPVQFTKGDRSARFFHISIDRVVAMMPGAEIATIENAGHAPMLDRPAEYCAVLTEFFERARVKQRSG